MRGLHCAWISFFLAFMIWFAPAPLLKEIQDTLSLSKQELWTSNITNDLTAIFTRIIMGPICDNYGARWPMAIVLMVASIPTAMLGLVNSASGLALIRFFIGIAGSSFVMSQFWPSRMFARDIAGTANGIVGMFSSLPSSEWVEWGDILFFVMISYGLWLLNTQKVGGEISVVPGHKCSWARSCFLPLKTTTDQRRNRGGPFALFQHP